MSVDKRRTVFLAAAAALWLALAAPRLGERYSFEWDSSQFARGVAEYNIEKHQPHAPGYPLYVLCLRALAPWTGGPLRAQTVLSILMTAGALLLFRAMADDAAAALLAFSPLTLLYGAGQASYSCDLLASCLVGLLAARVWSGDGRMALPMCVAVAAAAGFRQSGGTLLMPVAVLALSKLGYRQWRTVALSAAAGSAAFLAWFLPAAATAGGVSRFLELSRAIFRFNVSQTSVLMGAAWVNQRATIVDAAVFLATALSGVAVAAVVSGASRVERKPSRSESVFLAAWAAPALLFCFLLHSAKPGYLMLSLPPLVLLLARHVKPPAVAAGIAVALAVSYAPLEDWTPARFPGLALDLRRSAPRIALQTEQSNRQLAQLLGGVNPATPIVCHRWRNEAPNWRTASWDFPRHRWLHGADERPAREETRVAFLCDAAGPPESVFREYPSARRLGGDSYFSLWLAGGPSQSRQSNSF